MPVLGVARFERFFRLAAGLDVDKDDLKRYNEFVQRKLYDLLLIAQAKAKANGRDVVEPHDLPITKGLQECVHHYRAIDEQVDLKPILAQLTTYPPLDLALSEETQARLPEVVGGLSTALAQSFTIIEPQAKNPTTAQWERAFRLFDLLL
jgi:hypothetical protein